MFNQITRLHARHSASDSIFAGASVEFMPGALCLVALPVCNIEDGATYVHTDQIYL